MAEEGKKSYSNIFIANTIYPDAKSIFSFQLEPIEKIKEDCLVILDTNVLLAPYVIGKEDLLEQCRKTYGLLVAQKRLVVPGQVAREFAKNRQEKLAELYQQLIRKKQIHLKQEGYPLLSSLNEFKELVRLGEEASKKITAYQRAIDKVLAIIQGWNWNDPVSMLYQEIFTDETVVDIEINEDEVRKDLDLRKTHDIPPGYKDGGKKDEGVGDLLIWNTIVEVGRIHNKSVIFVTGDEKADWYRKSEGQPLYPRYELVDEFRRRSGGCSFHIVKFSQFLELFGAAEKVVDEVKKEEQVLNSRYDNSSNVLWKDRLIKILDDIDKELTVLVMSKGYDIRAFKDNMYQAYRNILEVVRNIRFDAETGDFLTRIYDVITEIINVKVQKDDSFFIDIYIEEAKKLQRMIKRFSNRIKSRNISELEQGILIF